MHPKYLELLAANELHARVKKLESLLAACTVAVSVVHAQADAAGTHETTQALTGAGIILGTVAYLSPEQVHAGTVDHRSDLFAFGLVLFEMFTGRVAFDGVTSVDTMHAILNRAPEGFEDALRAMPPAPHGATMAK